MIYAAIVIALQFIFLIMYFYSVGIAWKRGYFAGALAASYKSETGCTSKEAAKYAVRVINERGYPSDI